MDRTIPEYVVIVVEITLSPAITEPRERTKQKKNVFIVVKCCHRELALSSFRRNTDAGLSERESSVGRSGGWVGQIFEILVAANLTAEWLDCFLEAVGHRTKTTQTGRDILDDLFGEVRRFGEIIEVRKGVIFQPKQIEAGFVAGGEFRKRELPPTALRVLFGMPGFLPLLAVRRVVAVNELAEIFEAERLAFQGVVDVGPVVVVPDLLGRGTFARRPVVKKEDVRFHSLGVENAGGQTEDGVQFRGLHQLLPDGLPGPTFEKHIIGQNHGRPTSRLEQRADVLEEVELLVGGGRPEILSIVWLGGMI